MVECRNIKAERVAKYLNKIAESFKIWVHDDRVYAIFETSSLSELSELVK